MSRYDYSAATRCQRGHALTGYRDCYGRRVCVECRRKRDRLRKRRAAAKRKAAKP